MTSNNEDAAVTAQPSNMSSDPVSFDATETAKRLAHAAHAIAIERMARFNNTLTEDHSAAIYRLMEIFSRSALGLVQARTVVDLPTGGGKTQAVVSWLIAVHRLKLEAGIIVAASQIEALASIIRDLTAEGVPDEMIGLTHSKEDASLLPTPGNDQRQFLFVTHQRVRNSSLAPSREALLAKYRDRKRELLIWDEVFLSSTASAVNVVTIRSLVGALEPAVRGGPGNAALGQAVGHLKKCLVLIDAEIDRQRKGGSPHWVELPKLSELAIKQLSQAIRRVPKLMVDADALDLLFVAAGQPLRVAIIGAHKAVVLTADEVIPPSLTNIVILDAGHCVNRLVALDATVVRDEWFEGRDPEARPLKTYEVVKVHFRQGGSGRRSTTEDFEADEQQAMAKEVVRLVEETPANESILILTFKPRAGSSVDIPSLLKARLTKAGVDTEALTPEGKRRVHILTWGQHTSLNDHAHVQNIIFSGVQQRSDDDLLASAIGQTRDLLRPVEDVGSLEDIKLGEVAGVVYQALSRGACRITEGGRAKPMNVWLMYHEWRLMEELERLMPWLSWARWESPILKDGKQTKADTIALQIEGFLNGYDGNQISNRELKRRLGLEAVASSTFTRAVSAVEMEDWVQEDASFYQRVYWLSKAFKDETGSDDGVG